MLRKLIGQPYLIKLNVPAQCHRKLWWWTVMMFNRIDMERTKALGYDRTAAEWLLRNGACAKFVGNPMLFCDYNGLPPENTKFLVKEIEANEAGISDAGFVHLKGCEKLDKIVLNNCTYITDEGLQKLEYRKDSLKVLEITNCKNVTEDGLKSLQFLSKLEKLTVRNLPYVKNPAKVEEELKALLANCVIDIKTTAQ